MRRPPRKRDFVTAPRKNALRERLDIEKRVQQDPASLSRASTHIDKEVGLSLIAAIGLFVVGPALTHKAFPDSADLAVLVFLGLGVLLVGWQAVMSGRRFMRRQVIPVLAKALQPLRPSSEELSTVLAELKQLSHKIGKKLTLADLLSQLDPKRASQAG